MIVSLLVAAALTSSAAPTSAAPVTPRVLVLDVKTSTMDAASVAAFTKLVTHELAIALAPTPVVDVHEVARLADLEADRQDAGCTTTSCLAEVAGAYGAELVVFGEEAVLGDKHVLTLQLFDAKRAEARGRTIITVADVGDLPEHVPTAVRELVAALPNPALSATLTAKRAPPETSRPAHIEVVAPADGLDDNAGVIATAGYVTAGAFAALGVVGVLAGAVVLTTPTDPDSGPLGLGLFGAGAGMLIVAPLVAGGTWLLVHDAAGAAGAPDAPELAEAEAVQ